ncbi:MAG: glycosyl hydrolase family 18 protein [Candidatus Dormibacteria bacterium]
MRAALLLGALPSRLRAAAPGTRLAGAVALGLCAVFVLDAAATAPVRAVPKPGHRLASRTMPGRRLDFPAPALPAAVAAPAPAPPALLAEGPLAPHEIFGFAPYWTLDQARGFDLRSLSTVAYFGLDVNADGGLSHTGGGWDGYQSQALSDLITAGHRNRDRMVLTVKAFDADTLHHLANDPGVPARLSAEAVQAMRDKSFDGLNIDFEGQGPQERAPLAALVRNVAGAVHAANPAWQVTVDTYATSAVDQSGWFDVAAMAPAVDAFFVMAYDMYQHDNASPNSPLQNSSASVSGSGREYAALVGRNKVIIGAPFYGYDFETQDNQPASHSAGSPSPVVYSAIRDAARPEYWDADHMVPWTAYQDGGKWHEVYYDNPASLALKARAVTALHLLGVGVWALGMDGNDPAMMAALLGRARPLKAALTPAPPGAAPAPAAPAPAPAPAKSTAPAPTRSPSPKPSSSPSPQPSPSPSPVLPIP